jgi:hypothetical protein
MEPHLRSVNPRAAGGAALLAAISLLCGCGGGGGGSGPVRKVAGTRRRAIRTAAACATIDQGVLSQLRILSSIQDCAASLISRTSSSAARMGGPMATRMVPGFFISPRRGQ